MAECRRRISRLGIMISLTPGRKITVVWLGVLCVQLMAGSRHLGTLIMRRVGIASACLVAGTSVGMMAVVIGVGSGIGMMAVVIRVGDSRGVISIVGSSIRRPGW